MVSEEHIVDYVRQLEGVSEQEQRDKNDRLLRVFYYGDKIVLVVRAETQPLRIELRSDDKLAKTLQERYESVMESRALGRNGIEIICSGQLDESEIIDLIRHSYEQTRAL